jgi:hypothetical protein
LESPARPELGPGFKSWLPFNPATIAVPVIETYQSSLLSGIGLKPAWGEFFLLKLYGWGREQILANRCLLADGGNEPGAEMKQ